MVDEKAFRTWVRENTDFSDAVVNDTVSRLKRADGILAWDGNEAYLFYLERERAFTELSVSVKSQLRRAVRLYEAYESSVV